MDSCIVYWYGQASLRWLRALLWLFFFRSREENALALGRQLESHVSVALMNYKCQPVALDLEHTLTFSKIVYLPADT